MPDNRIAFMEHLHRSCITFALHLYFTGRTILFFSINFSPLVDKTKDHIPSNKQDVLCSFMVFYVFLCSFMLHG